MERFVILEHHHRGVHWDLMLVWGDVLRTWALAEPPQAGPSIQATPLPDHRLAYLDYEGPVSRDRGTVKRWDWGTYTLLEQREDCVAVRIEGETCQGTARLTRREGSDEWRFVLERKAPETT